MAMHLRCQFVALYNNNNKKYISMTTEALGGIYRFYTMSRTMWWSLFLKDPQSLTLKNMCL